MIMSEPSTQATNMAVYLSRLNEARIYPVTCLIQTYREYCLYTLTVTSDEAELSSESLLALVRAELSKIAPSQLLVCTLVRDDLLVRSKSKEETKASKVPVDRYKMRLLPRNLMPFFSTSYDVSVYLLPRKRFNLVEEDFAIDVEVQQYDLSVSLKRNALESNQNQDALMSSALFKSMNENTSINPRDRRYKPVTHFNCPICMENNIEISKGYKLKSCSHVFCKDCLKGLIDNADDVLEITCPHIEKSFFGNTGTPCTKKLTDLEIMYLLKNDFNSFAKYMKKRQNQNELAKGKDRIHCATPDCTGFFQRGEISEAKELPKFEKCSKCNRFNCFKCNKAYDAADHTCEATSQVDSLESLVQSGDVVRCPKCGIYLEKQSAGCQLIRCHFCRMDICWLTKLPRWGPNGKGDISGGCRCGVGGKKCHPNCNNCH